MARFGMDGGGSGRLCSPQAAMLKKPQKREKSDIINAMEAARVLHCSYRTILNLARDGTIPGVKIGRSYQFSRKALEDWRSRKLTETNDPAFV